MANGPDPLSATEETESDDSLPESGDEDEEDLAAEVTEQPSRQDLFRLAKTVASTSGVARAIQLVDEKQGPSVAVDFALEMSQAEQALQLAELRCPARVSEVALVLARQFVAQGKPDKARETLAEWGLEDEAAECGLDIPDVSQQRPVQQKPSFPLPVSGSQKELSLEEEAAAIGIDLDIPEASQESPPPQKQKQNKALPPLPPLPVKQKDLEDEAAEVGLEIPDVSQQRPLQQKRTASPLPFSAPLSAGSSLPLTAPLSARPGEKERYNALLTRLFDENLSLAETEQVARDMIEVTSTSLPESLSGALQQCTRRLVDKGAPVVAAELYETAGYDREAFDICLEAQCFHKAKTIARRLPVSYLERLQSSMASSITDVIPRHVEAPPPAALPGVGVAASTSAYYPAPPPRAGWKQKVLRLRYLTPLVTLGIGATFIGVAAASNNRWATTLALTETLSVTCVSFTLWVIGERRSYMKQLVWSPYLLQLAMVLFACAFGVHMGHMDNVGYVDVAGRSDLVGVFHTLVALGYFAFAAGLAKAWSNLALLLVAGCTPLAYFSLSGDTADAVSVVILLPTAGFLAVRIYKALQDLRAILLPVFCIFAHVGLSVLTLSKRAVLYTVLRDVLGIPTGMLLIGFLIWNVPSRVDFVDADELEDLALHPPSTWRTAPRATGGVVGRMSAAEDSAPVVPFTPPRQQSGLPTVSEEDTEITSLPLPRPKPLQLEIPLEGIDETAP